MGVNKELYDAILQHAHYLLGVEAHAAGQLNYRLKQALELAEEKIKQIVGNRHTLSAKQYREIAAAIASDMADIYDAGFDDLSHSLLTLLSAETIAYTRILADTLPSSLTSRLVFNRIPINVMWEIINKPIGGYTYADRVSLHTRRYAKQIRQALLEGLIAGEGVDKIMRRIRRVTEVTASAAARLARTEIHRASVEAMLRVFDANKNDVVSGIEYVATLDLRTCPRCGQFDRSVFYYTGTPNVSEAPEIPVHPNCYSEDTEVYTEAGWIPFPQLKAGMKVASLNPQTEEVEAKEVLATVEYYAFRCRKLIHKDFELVVSYDHPFFGAVKEKDVFVPAFFDLFEDLPENFYFILPDMDNVRRKRYVPLSEVQVEDIVYDGIVYDAEVEDNHTLIVRRKGAAVFGSNCRCIVDPETLIFTSKGEKPITQVRVGDKVLTHTGAYKEVTAIKHTPQWSGYVFKVITESGKSVLVTQDHPFWLKYTINGKEAVRWIKAQNIDIDDEVLVYRYRKLRWEKVVRLEWEKHYLIPVYNFEVADDRSYVANRIAVHNCVYIPFVASWEELGFKPEDLAADSGLAALDGEPADVVSYADWFASQDEDAQIQILGPKRYQDWLNGLFSFECVSQAVKNPKPIEPSRLAQLLTFKEKKQKPIEIKLTPYTRDELIDRAVTGLPDVTTEECDELREEIRRTRSVLLPLELLGLKNKDDIFKTLIEHVRSIATEACKIQTSFAPIEYLRYELPEKYKAVKTFIQRLRLNNVLYSAGFKVVAIKDGIIYLDDIPIDRVESNEQAIFSLVPLLSYHGDIELWMYLFAENELFRFDLDDLKAASRALCKDDFASFLTFIAKGPRIQREGTKHVDCLPDERSVFHSRRRC